jgi:hypothetical protein
MMAIVSLGRQHITIYDSRGKIMSAPVSTGQRNYETPPGIYSIIQKNRDHYSNLYDNAPMPFMQRITWSGIALHAGALPGYPASHGCIRMPHEFAGQLFGLTKKGMRVVVVRDDMAPIDFAHPALFKPVAEGAAVSQGVPQIEQAVLGPRQTRRSAAAIKAAAADAAAEKARRARRLARRAQEDAADYLDRLEVAEATKARAQEIIEEADQLSRFGSSSRLRAIKARAEDRLGVAQEKIDAIYAEGKAKIDAYYAARAAAKAAREASALAEEEARLAAEPMAPVTVFVSRKTQRLYVRQSFEPLFDTEVGIRDPDAPIGTTLFTALSYAGRNADELRWNALAMYPDPVNSKRGAGSTRQRNGEPTLTGSAAAKAALDRIVIPQEALDRINELVTPGSSLIVSDEDMSRETGKGTDIIVIMSGEPQGGIRRRNLRPYVYKGYGKARPQPTGQNPLSWW